MSLYYNSSYTKMDLTEDVDTGVNHKIRFSEDYLPTVFNEYTYSLNDVGWDPGVFKPRGTVLDYGCANGVFLDYLRAKGLPVECLYGFDVGADMVAAASAKGFNCTTDVGQLDKGSFDLVTLWDVIEHVPSPNTVIAQIKTLLKPGGRCIVQTPNFNDLGLLLGDVFAHYVVVEHLHLFSRQALKNCFQNVGFRCIGEASFGANAYEKFVAQPYKSAYDKLAKKHDFGATQVLQFELSGGA